MNITHFIIFFSPRLSSIKLKDARQPWNLLLEPLLVSGEKRAEPCRKGKTSCKCGEGMLRTEVAHAEKKGIA